MREGGLNTKEEHHVKIQTKDAVTGAEHKAKVTWMDSWQSVLNLFHFKKNYFVMELLKSSTNACI